MATDTIEKALYSLLASDGDISALVATRIYPNNVPQDEAAPQITYMQMDGVRDHTMEGPAGLVESRWEMVGWTETYAEARELATAIRQRLDSYRGTVGTVEIQGIFMDDEDDGPQRMPGVDSAGKWSKYMNFRVWYKETV